MKKVFSKILSAILASAALAVSAIFSFSCTGFNYNGDVSFTVDASKLVDTPTGVSDFSLNTFYIAAYITGEHNDFQMISATNVESKYNFSFDNIPVGTKVNVLLNIFYPRDPEGDQMTIPVLLRYSGKSDDFIVRPGKNDTKIKIHNVSSGNYAATMNQDYVTFNGRTEPVEFVNTIFCRDGRYKIYHNSTNYIYSEGTWSYTGRPIADQMFLAGTTITMTEYIYKDTSHLDLDNTGYDFWNGGENIITKAPVTQTFYLEDASSSITFRSGNG
ncbi:hypothetical protein, partial [Treponema sp.]|uniref:hypothetical protein n=1 Tax=Treponema sp. TaxID=166 RepID=UPI00298D6BCC